MLVRAFRSFSTLKHLSPYKILNVEQNASQQQIKTKYYQLAQKYHPDHDPSFTQKFKSINQAYQLLKDPQKRKQIDSFLTKGVNPINFTNYSSTRQSYGNAYQKNKSQTEQQLNKRKAKYQGKSYNFTRQNINFDFGIYNKNKQQNGGKNVRMKQQQNLIKTILTGIVALGLIFGVVQLVFKVYQFNNKGHKKDAQILAMQKRRNIQ